MRASPKQSKQSIPMNKTRSPLLLLLSLLLLLQSCTLPQKQRGGSTISTVSAVAYQVSEGEVEAEVRCQNRQNA